MRGNKSALNLKVVHNGPQWSNGPQTVAETVKRLWKPGMKLIVVTFCQTPEEQAEAYDRVHEICK